MTYRIGVDVGGTNTDGVVMTGNRVVAAMKTATTPDVTTGIRTVLSAILDGVDAGSVSAVIIGTTHFINAIAQGRGLEPVAAIRLATPPQSLLPMCDWPAHVRDAVGGHVYVCAGGAQFDGRLLCELDEARLRDIAADVRRSGIRRIALSSVFSSVNPEPELRAAEILELALPEVTVTRSAQIGRVGMLERENATVLNASLLSLADTVISGLAEVVRSVGVPAPVLLSQNDGTVMPLSRARKFPIFTIASGPTNSMRGGALLSGISDGVVIDVGGTTTDIGLLQRGFPRESAVAMSLAGVRSNFRVPDVFSMALGGGSVVSQDGTVVGPSSVGYRITEEALVFGGDVLTLTDIAVAAGADRIGDASAVTDIPRPTVRSAVDAVRAKVIQAIERTRLSEAATPVIVVGGGGPLLSVLGGIENMVIPDHAGVANAVGAAFAEAGGEVDRTYSLSGRTRAEVVKAAKEEAVQLAIDGGADPAEVRIIDVDDVPLTHLPGDGAVHVRVKAVGPFLTTASESLGRAV